MIKRLAPIAALAAALLLSPAARADEIAARWLAVPPGDILIGQGWDSAHARPAPNRCLDGMPVALTPPPADDSKETPVFTAEDLGAALSWKPEQRLAAWAADPPPAWLSAPLAGTPGDALTLSRRLTGAEIWLPLAPGPLMMPPAPAALLKQRPALSDAPDARRAALAKPAPGLRLTGFWAATLGGDRPGFSAACGDAVVIARLTGTQTARLDRAGGDPDDLGRQTGGLLMAVLPYAAIRPELPRPAPARAAPLLQALAGTQASLRAIALIRREGAPYLTDRAAPAAAWQRRQAALTGQLRQLKQAIGPCQAALAGSGGDACAVPVADWIDADRRLRVSLPPPADAAAAPDGRFLAPAALTRKAADWWLSPLEAARCPGCAAPTAEPLDPWRPSPLLSIGDDKGRCIVPDGRAEARLADDCPDAAALRLDETGLVTADGRLRLMRAPDRRDPASGRWVLRFAPPDARAYNGLPLLPLRLDLGDWGRLADLDACLAPLTVGDRTLVVTGPCPAAGWRIVARGAAK